MAPPLSVEAIWRRYDDDEQRLTAPVSERMLDLAGLVPGARVLDLATGRGEPAIRAAHRVGPSGHVVGVDTSPEMLRMARERADREGVTNLDLHVADAETLAGAPPGPPCDAVLARWCLMYMADPLAALVAAHARLRPGGVLVAAVWGAPDEVPYYTLPRRILARYHPVAPPDPAAPGTFALADPARLAALLAAAGFDPEPAEPFEVPVMEAHTPDELLDWTRAFGLGRLLAGAPEAVQAAWARDLVAETGAERGPVRLGGVTWLIRGKRP